MTIKLLFLGSGEFPVSIFKKLVKSDKIDVVGLVTSNKLEDDLNNDVFSAAKKFNINIYQPADINEKAEEILNKTSPDLIMVCNYGQFLGSKILNYPKYQCLNIHFSLLSLLRGACPIEAAILQGLKETGISIQLMEKKMDTGDILFQKAVEIDKQETGGTLAKKFQEISADNIEEVIIKWVNGDIKPVKQDHSKTTYCYRGDISKEAAKIDWKESAELIERKIRAFNPRPTAWTLVKTQKGLKRLKVFRAEVAIRGFIRQWRMNQREGGRGLNQRVAGDLKFGEVSIQDGKLLVKTGKGVLSLEEVQMEGKKKVLAKEFIHGFRDKIVLM